MKMTSPERFSWANYHRTAMPLQGADHGHGLIGQATPALRLHFDRLDEAPANVCPARRILEAVGARERVVAAVAVGLQEAAIVVQQAHRYLGAAARDIVEQHHRLRWRPARLYPHVAVRCCFLSGRLEHLHRRLVDVEERRLELRVAHQVVQRLQQFSRAHHPARKGLARHRHAVARVRARSTTAAARR